MMLLDLLIQIYDQSTQLYINEVKGNDFYEKKDLFLGKAGFI